MGNISYTMVQREYASDGKRLTVIIFHGDSFAPPYLMFQQMANIQVDSSDEFIKSIKINGFKAVEHYTYGNKRGKVMILLKKHLLVMVEEEKAENIEETVKIASSLPLKKIANAVK